MSQIRFFTDEDVYAGVAAQLRAGGLDAVSTPEAARLGESDLSQLLWSVQESRVLVTFNVTDFARLHHDWMTTGNHHTGLVVSKQRSLGDTVRRLLHLAQALSAEEMQDRLEYLNQW